MTSPFEFLDSNDVRLSDTQVTARRLLEDAVEAPGIDAKTPKIDKTAEWTVVVDLEAEFWNGENMIGSSARAAQLKSLAELTKDKPIALVVQHSEPAKASNDPKTSEIGGKGQILHRYAVRNGEVNELPSLPAGANKDNLQSIVGLAVRDYPANKFGLIMENHGEGNEGISGSNGETTLAELRESLDKGLHSSEKTKDKQFEFIDFDACLMGQDGVLDAMKGLTRHVVASTEIEGSTGQDVIPPLKTLIANPGMTGAELADSFIELGTTKRRSDDKEEFAGISTLSHYDMSQLSVFQKRLEKLGDLLAGVVEDPKAIKHVQDAVDSLKVFGGRLGPSREGKSLFGGKRDLKEFLTGVADKCDKGFIADKNGEIRASIKDVLAAETSLVARYYGRESYSSLGGLTVFIPDRSMHGTSKDDAVELGTRSREIMTKELVVPTKGWGKFSQRLFERLTD